jgi:DNA-binding transcriptional LysR family regulator
LCYAYNEFLYGPSMDFDDRAIRRLKLSDLRLLLAVVQWGGMAKAASHLNISQPAVSKAIAAMEHTLGVRLLDRNAQGVEPTAYGRELLKCAVSIFDELRQGMKRLEFLADPAAGELRIGSTEPLVAGLLPQIIDRLSREYPRIIFDVTQADIMALCDHELRERKVDLILGRMPISFAEDASLNVETLFDEQIFVVAGANSRWAHRRKIELADLVDEPWALPRRDSPVGSLMADAFRAGGLEPPQPSVVCFSFQMHNALLATGRFLSMASGSMLRLSAKRLSVKILPIELRIRPRPVGIVTLKNRTISPVAQLFIECAREVAKTLASDSRN